MTLPARILLDTNVWLDSFDGARPRSAEASKLIDLCVDRDIALLYATSTVKDVYYLVAASLKRQARAQGEGLSESQARAVSAYADACVETMGRIATAVGADESDIWLARKYQRVHSDFEDCLVLAAATRSQADYLATNDEGLLRHAPVPALSTGDLLALAGA